MSVMHSPDSCEIYYVQFWGFSERRGMWCREAMLAAAPDRDGPFLKVPKIMKENQE